jgi:hypothetical protein
MNKGDKLHLESITSENLIKFRFSNSFMAFASSSGSDGVKQIGVNGLGQYVVKLGGLELYYSDPEKAVELYKDSFK